MALRLASIATIGLLGAILAGPVSAETPPSTPTPAPKPEDVHLLDDIPDYVSALRDQWSGSDMPAGMEGFVTDTEHYGLLRELTEPKALTLDDCIALALANNTDLRISRLGPLGARTQVRRAYSIFDPSLFADVTRDGSAVPATSILSAGSLEGLPGAKGRNQSRNLTGDLGIQKTLLSGGRLSLALRSARQVQPSAFLAGLIPQYQSNLTLQLNQPLLRDFGLYFTTLQVRIARATEESAVKQYEASVASTIKGVEQAYWALVQAEQNVNVQEQGLALAKELQRQNEGKFNVGAAPRTAVLEAQAEVARRESTLIQGQNARSIARDALRAVINAKSPDVDALMIIEPSDTPKVESYHIDLQQSLATALENRPELAAAKLNLQSSGMQLKIAENQLLPRLNAVGSFGTSGVSGGQRPPVSQTPGIPSPYGGPYEQTFNDLIDGRYYSYSAGLTIEVPLSNAAARADYAQTRVNLEQSRLGLQQLQENVTLEVKRAVTNLESDLKSIDATKIASRLAEENLRNQKARYDVGLATTKDILDFQDRLTQAKAAEIQALTTYNTDLAELRRVEGTLLEARHVELTTAPEESTPFWARF